MRLACKLLGHKPMLYGSQGRIAAPYHDGIGRAHRLIEAKCWRCGSMFRVGSVIDQTHQLTAAANPESEE